MSNISIEAEPRFPNQAEAYMYFEEFLRGTLDYRVHPGISTNKTNFMRHVYRYSALQRYDLAQVREILVQTFGEENRVTIEKWKVNNIKNFPLYKDYKDYFGLNVPELNTQFDFIDNFNDKSENEYDPILDIAKRLADDQELAIKYIFEFEEFVYWCETEAGEKYYKLDWGAYDLAKIIFILLEENRCKVRMPNVNSVLDYIKRINCTKLSEWDQDRSKLVFRNGIFDIANSTFNPPNKEYLAFRVIEHSYKEVKNLPPIFQKFFDNLEWNQYDQTRYLVALKSSIDHTAFDAKKMFVHFGVPNSGKSTIYHIFAGMLGEDRVALISLDWLLNQFVFGNAASWSALIIDEIETDKLERFHYQRIKMISNGAAIPAMKKHADFRTIRPTFVTHQTMNGLYLFPDNVLTEPISKRFIMFKYSASHSADSNFQNALREEAPDLLDYLLTANLPRIDEISPIPETGLANDFDFEDPDIVMNYWEIETNRFNNFISNLFMYKTNTYITLNSAAEQIKEICRKNGYRIDKYFFRKRLLPMYVAEINGTIRDILDPKTGTKITIIQNVQIIGAKGHFHTENYREAEINDTQFGGK